RTRRTVSATSSAGERTAARVTVHWRATTWSVRPFQGESAVTVRCVVAESHGQGACATRWRLPAYANRTGRLAAPGMRGSEVHDSLTVALKIPRPWPRHHGGSGGRYWPAIITVWHREPGGHDSGAVCKPYRRVFDEGTRTWRLKPSHAWRLHFWHWRIQV